MHRREEARQRYSGGRRVGQEGRASFLRFSEAWDRGLWRSPEVAYTVNLSAEKSKYRLATISAVRFTDYNLPLFIPAPTPRGWAIVIRPLCGLMGVVFAQAHECSIAFSLFWTRHELRGKFFDQPNLRTACVSG